MRRWLCCLVILALAGCSKSSDNRKSGNNSIQFSISSVVNGHPLVLKDSTYHNAVGEAFNVTTFRYYLSNFSVTTAEGSVIKLPATYYLVDEANASSRTVVVDGIPDGSYTAMSFLIGVDSLTQVGGPQNGALDVVNGMYWSWNSGYINAKFEGTSPVSSAPGNILQFHIGGFQAPYNTIRSVTLPLAQPQVWAGGQHIIKATADLYSWFNGDNSISFAKFYGTMEPDADAMKVADNYREMFTITSITTP